MKFAISTASATFTSGADGSLPALPITFPSTATGNYNISAFSETSPGSTASVTVTDSVGGGDTGGGSTDGGSATGGETLPATGIDSGSLRGLWVGGGALVLAGGAIALTAAVRRNRKEHAGV